MTKYLQNRLALSDKGVKDLKKGIFSTILCNLTFMLPTFLSFIFLNQYLLSYIQTGQSIGKGITFFSLLSLILIVLAWFITIYQYRATFTTIYEESAQRRLHLAEKLRRLPLSFFGERNLSDLTSTIMSDCTAFETLFSHAIPQLFAAIVSISLIIFGLFFLDWRLALSLLWVTPLALSIILLSKAFQKKRNTIINKNQRAVSDYLQESLDNIQEIKAYSKEEDSLSKLQYKLDTYEKSLITGELLTGALVNGSQGLLKLGLVTVTLTGAKLYMAGSLDLLTYIIFLIIGSQIFDPIEDVFNHLAALFYLDVRLDRAKEMENLPTQRGIYKVEHKNYDIEFKNVSFAYKKGQSVLQNISFTAKQGEITALIGPSGGGKSSTAKVAARFWDIDSGQILLGGEDIGHIDPETLLANYAVVFQDVTLFNASIIDNIRIGKKEASDEEVLRAARLAQCDDFIKELPLGYNTVIGENGDTLSGGGKQRLSIARALLKDAPIILLDEATASLDAENESKIQEALSELIKNKTVLIIAHRMRTVAQADKIIVLKEGQIAEQGDPRDLIAQNGIFAAMIERQKEA